MPTPSSSSASLQHTFDPQNVWSTPASCPPEAERAESHLFLAEPSAYPNDVAASEAAHAGASRQQPIQNTSSTQQTQTQPQTTQLRPPTMDSDSDLSSISTISGLSPVVPEMRSPSSSGSSDGKDQQEEEDMSPRPLYYADHTITSDNYLSNVRVSTSCSLQMEDHANATMLSKQLLPSYTSSLLRPGSKFIGTQQSDRQNYKVEVDIKNVNMAESFLCGYLRIEGTFPANLFRDPMY